jgi:aminopeptidase N
MSSYLLAFVVSDFDFISNGASLEDGDTLHRIYARKSDVANTQFALDNGVKFLKELENFNKFSYELEKMYQVAIPDFGAGESDSFLLLILFVFTKLHNYSGAMENWGLITYKEQYLIGNENSHPRDVLEILLTVAHELAHQFYGNSVTCKWWDYIWLNEGFATLFEYLLVDRVYPDERMQHYFNLNALQYAMRSDAKETTRAMLKHVETPKEIGDLFDNIAYQKGLKKLKSVSNSCFQPFF